MQHNSAQPSHLRRRYQASQDQKQRNGFRTSTSDTTLDGPNGLELSMHLPSEPYRNRFDVLRAPSPAPRFKPSVHPQPRRYRHSRGTREAKRRRDARRNQRKLLAAQELDERLSRDIDSTLRSANIYRPPQLRLPAPKPARPVLNVEPPQPAYMPPTSPQLQCLDFGCLDLLRDFPQLARFVPSPAPLSPPLFAPQVPRWCPNIPSIVNRNNSKDDALLFFDLSSLPEPSHNSKPTPRCRKLQLWQPKVSPQPAKQSRFFPSRPSSTQCKVQLPTSCVLHQSDKGVQVDLPPRSQPLAQHTNADRVQQRIINASPDEYEQTEASAANLWRILNTKQDCYKDIGTDPYVESFAPQHPEDPLSLPFGMFDTRMEAIGMPAELDSTELPYVHANSLTGQGNERAEYPQREPEEHRTVIYDSSWKPIETEEWYPGTNEMMVDHDFDHQVYDEDEGRYWDA